MCHVLRAKCKEALELTQRASFPQQGATHRAATEQSILMLPARELPTNLAGARNVLPSTT